MIRVDLEALESAGWCDLGDRGDADLLRLAAGLGTPVPPIPGDDLVDRLAVRGPDPAHPGWYMSIYGTGPIPFHTDCTYHRVPPRYVVMRLPKGHESDRATLLLDLREASLDLAEREILRREPWYMRTTTGTGRRIGRILEAHEPSGQELFRFDRAFMWPYLSRHAMARAVLARIERTTRTTSVHWQPGQAIVLDNWRVLHARAPGPAQAPGGRTRPGRRVLERVLIAAS